MKKYQIQTGEPAGAMRQSFKNDSRINVIGDGEGDSLVIETDSIHEVAEDYCAIFEAFNNEK
jgi:hypothetical protein